MHFGIFLWRRDTRAAIALLAAACLIAQRSPAAGESSSVRFGVAVPPTPEQMQIYQLAPTGAPLEFLNEKLRGAKLTSMNLENKSYIVRGTTGLNEVDRVRAYADPVSGDAHFIPSLAELARTSPVKSIAAERAQVIARTALSDLRFIPKDVTQARIAEPITVMGGAIEHAPKDAARMHAAERTEAKKVLTIVPAVRYAADFRVYGRGSHALVSIANDESIVGALRRWRTASLGEHIKPTITANQVRADIERQLRPYVASRGTHATVDKIVLAYYDANANYLQPVYRFEATVQPGNKRVSGIKVAGYVPIGKVLEPIPDLARAPVAPTPLIPKRSEPGELAAKAKRIEPLAAEEFARLPAEITLGEYANQDWPNNGAYVDMSNTFLSGLSFGNTFFHGGSPRVTRTQWYTAFPWEVVGPSSQEFLNAVNVAYTVPHGNWLLNTTLSDDADFWQVPDIGTGGNPGYGAAAGGVLATWVIMSCEVIPSMYDRQNEAGASDDPYTAFDAWWPVFQGLHNVIGFRTVMFYPDDDLQFGFGMDAAVGGDINAAWFQEVAANDGDDGTYNDGHLTGAPLVHYDRASTMIDARDLGQSIYSVGAQSASTTLWNFWMSN
jgi:hypothetical protein